MKVVYFASVRERVGLTEEEVAPPRDIATVRDLMAWLAGQSEGHAAAFAEGAKLRAALDHTHAPLDALLGAAREVAFFPPMTGG